MSVKKKDRQFNDAKGNTHKHFADGRSEMYIGGFDKDADYVECTDGADKAANRKRFLRYIAPPVEETVQHNDPEIATRLSPDEIQKHFDKADKLFAGKTFEDGAVVSDDAVPGVDLDDDEN